MIGLPMHYTQELAAINRAAKITDHGELDLFKQQDESVYVEAIKSFSTLPITTFPSNFLVTFCIDSFLCLCSDYNNLNYEMNICHYFENGRRV